MSTESVLILSELLPLSLILAYSDGEWKLPHFNCEVMKWPIFVKSTAPDDFILTAMCCFSIDKMCLCAVSHQAVCRLTTWNSSSLNYYSYSNSTGVTEGTSSGFK